MTRSWVRRTDEDGNRLCADCKMKKPLNEFYFARKGVPDSYQSVCKKCANLRTNNYRKLNPHIVRVHQQRTYAKNWVTREFGNLRYKAQKRGIPFTISLKDITLPEFCPVFGVRLEVGGKGGTPNSPSVDRFNPLLGYVLGNVCVISKRANAIKNNATIEELESVIRWMERWAR